MLNIKIKIKIFFILFLFGFFFSLTYSKSFAKVIEVADCPVATGNDYVACGANSPAGNGEIFWSGRKETFNNVTMLQALLTLTKESEIHMLGNSVFKMDPGGCVSKCDLSENLQVLGTNFLELREGSRFFHSYNYDSLTLVKDNISILVKSDSILSLGIVREDDLVVEDENSSDDLCNADSDRCSSYHTEMIIEVNDSTVAINQIEFKKSGSSIKGIYVSNNDQNRGKYTFNLNGVTDSTGRLNVALKTAFLENLSLTNADMIIGGDVITYGGFINRIDLRNSDLVLRGNEFAQTTAILITDGSVFKASAHSGSNHILQLGGGIPLVQVESGSKLLVQDILLNNPDINFQIRGKESELRANKIYYDSSVIQMANNYRLSVFGGAIIDINTIDARTSCIDIGSCNSNINYFSLSGDSSSSFRIGEILINEDNVQVELNGFYGSIGTINYEGDNFTIGATARDNVSAKIGEINISSITDKSLLTLANAALEIKDFNFTQQGTIEFVFTRFNLTGDNISCSLGCSSIAFIGDNTSTAVLNNFNSNYTSDLGGNTFRDISMTFQGNYNGSGLFEIDNSKIVMGSLTGMFSSFNLLDHASLEIRKNSDITLNSNINIDGTSKLTIRGEQVFANPKDINIINAGTLDILAGNDFESLDNKGYARLDGDSNIQSIQNSGTLELYTGAYITNLVNTSRLVVSGSNYIKYFDHQGGSIQFVASARDLRPSLLIGEMITAFDDKTDLSIRFSGLDILKPGMFNRYNIIATESGAIGLTSNNEGGGTFHDALDILPPWLLYETGIDFNNYENDINGETAWVNIQRLTNYKALVSAVPGYNQDESILGVAGGIDDMVLNGETTISMEDIVNSLDMNSGCGLSEQIIYEVHQGKETINISEAPCLYTMAENINKLKAVSNELYGIYSHANVAKTLDAVIEANREYIYKNELYTWTKADFSLISLNDKEKNKGFNGLSTMLYAGASISPAEKYNLSAIIGGAVGGMNGNLGLFDSKTFSINTGLAASYLSKKYYMTGATIFGITTFDTNRIVDFLDNEFSNNREINSKSDLSVTEMAFKFEIGKEYTVRSDTFFTPKLFISQAFLNNTGYSETGSSASLVVDSSSMMITDFGIGLEYGKELLMSQFWLFNKAFWYPTFGVTAMQRQYNSPDTAIRFLGVSESYAIDVASAGYSGPMLQGNISLMIQDKTYALQLGYVGEASITGYQNHSLQGTLKYSLR